MRSECRRPQRGKARSTYANRSSPSVAPVAARTPPASAKTAIRCCFLVAGTTRVPDASACRRLRAPAGFLVIFVGLCSRVPAISLSAAAHAANILSSSSSPVLSLSSCSISRPPSSSQFFMESPPFMRLALMLAVSASEFFMESPPCMRLALMVPVSATSDNTSASARQASPSAKLLATSRAGRQSRG